MLRACETGQVEIEQAKRRVRAEKARWGCTSLAPVEISAANIETPIIQPDKSYL